MADSRTGNQSPHTSTRMAAPVAPPVRHPKRIPLYFSEPPSEHPRYGSGCVTYPVDLVMDASTGTEASVSASSSGQPHPRTCPPANFKPTRPRSLA